MASSGQFRVRGRTAHTAGPTHLSYTPDGTRLVTVGSNNTTRVYIIGYDGEPSNIDDCQEQNLAVDATNDFFVTGSEDGMVSMYSLISMSFDKFLIRSTLPIRDVALSPDGEWCAVASDELVVKIVNTSDTNKVLYLRDQPKPIKHLSFHPSGKQIALSGSDGCVYIYSLAEKAPELVRRVDGLVRTLETDSDISAHVAWHPDGRAFAAPTATRDIQVVSVGDWEHQRAFASINGHSGDVTSLAWSANGAMLATAGKDNKILLWETKTQKVLQRYDYANVRDLAWHPIQNSLSFTTSDGEVYIYNDFVPQEHAHLLIHKQPAPFIHDPLGEISNNVVRPAGALAHKDVAIRRNRAGSYDSLNDILGSEIMGEDDDFVVDDDGAGYAVNVNGKRTNGHLDIQTGPFSKRVWAPDYHQPFQPGATPWRGNRKYLCLNIIGFVWTVDQETHNTVTVEFYDQEYYRDFHFTDTYLYDKACLNEKGTLFSSPPRNGEPATLFYRPHETWTSRADWRVRMPRDESVAAMSLSDSYITVVTSAGYVRVYSLFGTPFRVYRQKAAPVVTCASWRDYVLTMGNGPVAAGGCASLLYTIENIKRDEVCQSEDIVALPPGATLKSVFFSDRGDPCIYDSTGVLLTLLHWRTPSQARWVPLLDTTALARLADGRKTESYWPVAVAGGKFHCIILKGTEQYPYFPRPLLSEFEFQIPLATAHVKASSTSRGKKGRRRSAGANGNGDIDDDDNDDEDEDEDEEIDGGSQAADGDADADSDDAEKRRLEEQFVQQTVELAQLTDLAEAFASTAASTAAAAATQRRLNAEAARRGLEADKTLLQMLMAECAGGDERGMKALELARWMRDASGRMLEAAGKVAERYGQQLLGERIRRLAEGRMAMTGDGEGDADGVEL